MGRLRAASEFPRVSADGRRVFCQPVHRPLSRTITCSVRPTPRTGERWAAAQRLWRDRRPHSAYGETGGRRTAPMERQAAAQRLWRDRRPHSAYGETGGRAAPMERQAAATVPMAGRQAHALSACRPGSDNNVRGRQCHVTRPKLTFGTNTTGK